VRGVSLAVNEGQIVGLVGANGAGKTSTLNASPAWSGAVAASKWASATEPAFDRRHRPLRPGAGGAGRQLFPEMSVMENLELGAFLQNAASKREQAEKVFAQFPLLRERAYQRAGTLSGGEQQMLAVARALMARPAMLLIDEPCLGLSPKMVAGWVR